MADELKPCPFCGGEATEGPVSVNGKPSGDIGWVGCVPCGVFVSYTHGEVGRREAMRAWNTRAERTCRIEWRGEVYESEDCIEEDGSYFCTACDQELTGSLAEAWDDYQAWGYKGEQPFRNCPNCGAKIEGGGR